MSVVSLPEPVPGGESGSRTPVAVIDAGQAAVAMTVRMREADPLRQIVAPTLNDEYTAPALAPPEA